MTCIPLFFGGENLPWKKDLVYIYIYIIWSDFFWYHWYQVNHSSFWYQVNVSEITSLFILAYINSQDQADRFRISGHLSLARWLMVLSPFGPQGHPAGVAILPFRQPSTKAGLWHWCLVSRLPPNHTRWELLRNTSQIDTHGMLQTLYRNCWDIFCGNRYYNILYDICFPISLLQ